MTQPKGNFERSPHRKSRKSVNDRGTSCPTVKQFRTPTAYPQKTKDNFMSIITQAKAELDAINFGEEDTVVMIDILEQFFDQWDSGGAVSVAAPVLMRLLKGQPLAPLTGSDDEWHDPIGDGKLLQNVRCGSVFKQCEVTGRGRGGMHPYDIDNESWDGRFPYDPETKMVTAPVFEVTQR